MWSRAKRAKKARRELDIANKAKAEAEAKLKATADAKADPSSLMDRATLK